jgi:hypothetical protein
MLFYLNVKFVTGATMEELQWDLLHRRNDCYARLLARGHRARGLAASPPNGTLLFCALHQGKFFLSERKRNEISSLRIVTFKYQRHVMHGIAGSRLLWIVYNNLQAYTYYLNQRSRALEKLTCPQQGRNFAAFCETRRFITACTSDRQLSLSWASSIESMSPHPTSWRYILILSSHLRLGLSHDLIPLSFPTETLYTPLFSPTSYTPRPSHSSQFDYPNNIGWGV